MGLVIPSPCQKDSFLPRKVFCPFKFDLCIPLPILIRPPPRINNKNSPQTTHQINPRLRTHRFAGRKISSEINNLENPKIQTASSKLSPIPTTNIHNLQAKKRILCKTYRRPSPSESKSKIKENKSRTQTSERQTSNQKEERQRS